MNTFFHGGDLGDAIYSLAAVKALGGGIYYLGIAPICTALPMQRHRAELLLPLIAVQPYITKAEYIEGDWIQRGRLGPDVTYDLDNFRGYLGEDINLAEMHLRAFSQPLEACVEPWLSVDKVTPSERSVVIHKTGKYQNKDFPWQQIIDKYIDRAIFIGSASEYDEFKKTHAVELPYQPTPTLLDLARLIAGCELFIGNESSPFAIAEGLKKKAILEMSPTRCNCNFHRKNVGYNKDIE